MVGGVLVIALGFAAWVAPFALTETSCWVARAGADGSPIYAPIPVPVGADLGGGGGQFDLGLQPTDLGTGCHGGTFTIRGAAMAAVFGIGAVSVAGLASSRRAPRAAREEFA